MLPSEDVRIRGLARLARALAGSEPLNAILETAAEEARTAMDAASVSLARLVPGTQLLRTVVNVGDLGPGEVRWPEDETYVIEEFRGLRQVVDGLQFWTAHVDDPDCLPVELELLTSLGKGRSLAAPMFVDGRLWGEFYSTRHRGERAFDDSDIACMDALIAILAGAVSRALREESLEQLAYRDPLTGLLNRRAFLSEFGARMDEGRVGLITLDVDRFKRYNDTYGHPAGDAVLWRVAKILRSAAGKDDLVARMGGEEFVVLLPGASLARASAFAERLRTAFHAGEWPQAAVTASFGVTVSGPDDGTDSLLVRADHALYRAKKLGRDRVALAS